MPSSEFTYPVLSTREILKPDIILIAPEAPLDPSAANCTVGTCWEADGCPDGCAYAPENAHTEVEASAQTPQHLGSICMK